MEGQVWDSVSEEAKDFIRKLLVLQPHKRPSAQEALHLPWIKNLAKIQVDERTATTVLSNLKSFHKQNLVKYAAMNFIGSQLVTKQEKNDIIKVFK